MPIQLTTYYEGSRIPDLPGDNYFHSKELFLVYEATARYHPRLIVASINGKPVAKLLAVIKRNNRILLPSFTNRCEVIGEGEYMDSDMKAEELFGVLVEHLTNEVKRDAFLIEFRNLNAPLFGYKYFRMNQYFPINWLRVRNSIHSLKHPMDRISATRKRQIRKGLMNGAQIGTATTEEEVNAFSHMLRKNYSSKIRKHFPDSQFFHHLLQQNRTEHRGQIFLVKHKNKIIGGSVCVFSGNNAYLLFSGGMRKTYAKLYPGVLAVWKAIEYCYRHQYEHLEFMDVGLPFRKHGYREFVLRFGGKQSSTRRWFLLRWKFLNKILEKIYV